MDDNDGLRGRDKRTEKRFYIDNEFVDNYGPIIGPYGHAVYNVLVRHATPDGLGSYPSYATIAKKAGCGVTKVKEVIKQFADLGLINFYHRYEEKEGVVRQTSNEYEILDPPPMSTPVSCGDTPGAARDTPVRVFRTPPINPHSYQSSSIFPRKAGNNGDGELEYVPLEEVEATKRPKWQIPDNNEQSAFLEVCGAKWFKEGQKARVKAILSAIRAGDVLGEKVYQACLDRVQDKPNLKDRNIELPPVPRTWLEFRSEQAKSHRWSVAGFIEAMLERDQLVVHCNYQLRKAEQEGTKEPSLPEPEEGPVDHGRYQPAWAKVEVSDEELAEWAAKRR